MYKVLIVDDHVVVREGLKLLIETNESFTTIGEAGNGLEALHLVEELAPDIVLMDLYMPIMSGLDAIKSLHTTHPDLPVIILTTYNEDKLMAQGVDFGVKGYLLKDTSLNDLFESMTAALNGDTLIDGEMMRRILDYRRKSELYTPLSKIEIITLQAVANGMKSKEIAEYHGISERTVKSRLTNIFNKLGVFSRAEAVAVAMHEGLIKLED